MNSQSQSSAITTPESTPTKRLTRSTPKVATPDGILSALTSPTKLTRSISSTSVPLANPDFMSEDEQSSDTEEVPMDEPQSEEEISLLVDTPILSAYEKKRLENIAKNNEELVTDFISSLTISKN